MKKEIKILLRRAESFIRDSMIDLNKGDYDLALFHIEQACQLIIKAKLLETVGFYEKTHSLRKLLSDLAKFYKRDEIRNFIRENYYVLKNLEAAHITSRYLPEEFTKEEVEDALKLYKKLKELLWNS